MKMYFVLAIITLSLVCICSNITINEQIFDNMMDKPAKELFKIFHFLNKKSYDINTEEAIAKYKIFYFYSSLKNLYGAGCRKYPVFF